MTKIITIFTLMLVMALSVVTPQTRAQMGSMMGIDRDATAMKAEGRGESIEAVLQDILVKQNSNTVQELDCEKVGGSDLERLGDAVMEQQHPGQAHEVMDKMMGGEGSESLRQMHSNMGNAYLGCGEHYGPGMMMGGGMMGYGNNRDFQNQSSMMGYGVLGGYGILSSLTWVLLIIFLSSGTYFFIKQARKK